MLKSCTFSILLTISATSAALVTWLPNTSFNLPLNFKDGKLPCSKQTVVFPKSINTAVVIDDETIVGGLILPTDGDIIVSDGALEFGTDDKKEAKDEETCSKGENVYYMPRASSTWAQPDSWSSDRFNKATPDAERVPCYDDDVVFPVNSEFTLFLPNEIQNIKSMNVSNVLIENMEDAVSITPVFQIYVVNNFGGTGIVIKDTQCLSRAGCPCQDHVEKVNCAAKYCPKPKCIKPVKPIGHCCRICGGYILVDVDEDFEMLPFQEKIDKIVSEYGGDNVVYHIGRVPGDKVQVVVVDKGEYDYTSSKVTNEILHQLSNDNFKVHDALYSASPLSLSGMGGKIAVSMFFVVLLLMSGLYAYYYKLPKITMPVSGRSFNTMITRFNRRSDSVVSLTRRGSTMTIGSVAGTAFRNPLYDSRRGRVVVAESVVEE